jgi:hypothetical protein
MKQQYILSVSVVYSDSNHRRGLSKCINNATCLVATSVGSPDGTFMNLIEENVFNRMTCTAQNGVIVKPLYQI